MIYKNTLNEFEDFCADFSDHFIDLIINYNCSYKNSFVLTNQCYRRAVIKRGYSNKEELTDREKECLIWASRGKSTKEIAKILKISPHTIATYSKKIKEKLNCTTMVEAVIEGVHRGVIGSINQWNHFDSPTIGSFKIIKNMDAARKEIAKTSLVLFNSV
ncbi:MAG: helix-turn-helix transcriptional regulator [Gammaproteobacteria bacterium]|nr:helix-turn-helix transcriptional regulator [Gammaproteobacteria bacterium]